MKAPTKTKAEKAADLIVRRLRDLDEKAQLMILARACQEVNLGYLGGVIYDRLGTILRAENPEVQ